MFLPPTIFFRRKLKNKIALSVFVQDVFPRAGRFLVCAPHELGTFVSPTKDDFGDRFDTLCFWIAYDPETVHCFEKRDAPYKGRRCMAGWLAA